ncbi:ATP-dependent helicase Rep [Caerostris extrusa]|uniref:ATP-dependent helicase Rep n=1 Tax=Caerostris extrusa TaxID=172846 RepID=A0AAV4MJ81_CAEEX|nr:ATP-dependent helicase Rep [Caerostris extrusa]
MAPRQYAKRWCFTINNPRVNDHPSIWLQGHDNYGFQYEIGQNNTPHVQGFVCFTERRSNQHVKLLHSTAHWETMKGTIKQNIEYCSKKDTSVSDFYSFNLNNFIKENPLTKLQNDCEEQNTLLQVYKENFSLSCKYHTFIQKYFGLQQKPRNHITSCVVITGPTGTGKTGQISSTISLAEFVELTIKCFGKSSFEISRPVLSPQRKHSSLPPPPTSK